MCKWLAKTSLVVLALVCGCANAFAQSALQQEINEYVDIFSGNNFAAQRSAIEPLGWSGISSPELYDVIAAKLEALKDADSKIDKERASWFAKALALSGNNKYQPVLQDIADNASAKKLRKHAKTALERLPRYARWNPIIAAGLKNSQGNLAEQRIRNMLADNDAELFRLGAKRVYHAHASNKELVALVKSRLVADYASVNDSDHVDAMAWAIKVLAQSGDSDHKPLLAEIAQSASNKKIRKYAKKYTDYL